MAFGGEILLPVFAAAFAADAGVFVVEAIAARKPAGSGTGDSFGGTYIC